MSELSPLPPIDLDDDNNVVLTPPQTQKEETAANNDEEDKTSNPLLLPQIEESQRSSSLSTSPLLSPVSSPALLPIKESTPIYPFLFRPRFLPESSSIPLEHMPVQHLDFTVIHATGWDENYPPTALIPKDRQSQGNDISIRHGKGWQSPRLCAYPQEIILQLSSGLARILKIQILSHHYKIASKLDIYVGSVQRRKEMVGMAHSDDVRQQERQEKQTFSWDQIPKIIDNDCEGNDELMDEEQEQQEYNLIRMNDEPYVHFRRLGYIELDRNERANFKARELKSVRLDAEGEYIRLVARRCHANQLNHSNQVGIVGITVMGEPVNDLLEGESQTIPLEHVDDDVSRVASPETVVIPVISQDTQLPPNVASRDHSQGNFASLYSILPSAVSNNVAPEKPTDFLQNNEQTTTLIAAFGRAKEAAVKVEDFQLAKVMKESIELVQSGAEKVEKLNALKTDAVQKEDFNSAAKYKSEIEDLKMDIQNSFLDEGFQLDENGDVVVMDDAALAEIIGLAEHPQVPPIVEPPTSRKNTQHSSSRKSTKKSVSRENTQNHSKRSESAGQQRQQLSDNEQDVSIVTDMEHFRRSPSPALELAAKSRSSSNASKVNPATFSSATASDQEPLTPTSNPAAATWEQSQDERPLPALSNSKTSTTDIPLNPPQDDLADDEPEELTDLVRAAFPLSVQVFGDHMIACFFSKKFKLREQALIDITKKIDITEGDGLDVGNVDKLQLFKAAFQIMQEGLNDNRERLTLQSLTLWEKLTSFCVHHQIPMSATFKFVDQTFQSLFNKIADTNPRIKQSSTDLFVTLARTYRTPTQSAASLVLKPAHSQTQSQKQAKAKVELITRLVNEFGVTLIPKNKFEKDAGLSLEGVMEVAVSYLNHSNGEVRDAAVKLIVEVCRYTDRDNVEVYLTDVKPLLVENIRKLAMNLPPPPPVIKMLDVDESLLQRPLAKRGTVTRLQQQLMEVKAMVNNVNHFVADDYGAYIANTQKNAPHVPENEGDDNDSAPVQTNKESEKTSAKKTSTGRTSKGTSSSTASTAKNSTVKKLKKSDEAASTSLKQKPAKTSASATRVAAANSKVTTSSRRGSTEEEKSSTKTTKSSTKTSHAKPPETPLPPTVYEDDESKSDRCCIFCDERNEDFTEDNLVTHYWNECPVLTKCPLCNIILEISTLDDHMLNGCDKSKFVKQCPRCREVIQADSYLEHVAKQTCMVIPPHIVRCPLCKANVKPNTEDGWKAHLLDVDGCSKNRRKNRPSTGGGYPLSMSVKETGTSAPEKRLHRSATDAPKSSAPAKSQSRKTTSSLSKDKTRKTSTKTKVKS